MRRILNWWWWWWWCVKAVLIEVRSERRAADEEEGVVDKACVMMWSRGLRRVEGRCKLGVKFELLSGV